MTRQNNTSQSDNAKRCYWLIVIIVGLLIVLAPIIYLLYEEKANDALEQNFRLVRPGMTPTEVERLLGPPHVTPSGPNAGHWQYEDRTLFILNGVYDVFFVDGVVESTYEDPF